MSKGKAFNAIVSGNPLARVDLRQELLRSQSQLSFQDCNSGLKSLTQGDVLISRSGNARLALKTEVSDKDLHVLFLTRSRNDQLGLEKALLSKVDLARLLGVVKRVAGNPLARFSDLASNLAQHLDILNNAAALLTCGALGVDLRNELINSAAQGLVSVQVGVSMSSQRIQVIGVQDLIPEIMLPVTLQYSASGLPANDYIESVIFPDNQEADFKERFMVACVLANTIGNARNLAGLHLALDDSSGSGRKRSEQHLPGSISAL